MFSRFQKEGVLSTKVGHDYRNNILGKGASKSGVHLLQDFLGAQPSVDSFLKHLGIL